MPHVEASLFRLSNLRHLCCSPRSTKRLLLLKLPLTQMKGSQYVGGRHYQLSFYSWDGDSFECTPIQLLSLVFNENFVVKHLQLTLYSLGVIAACHSHNGFTSGWHLIPHVTR